MRKSPKEIEIENEILAMLSGKSAHAASFVFNDQEAQALQNYANLFFFKVKLNSGFTQNIKHN